MVQKRPSDKQRGASYFHIYSNRRKSSYQVRSHSCHRSPQMNPHGKLSGNIQEMTFPSYLETSYTLRHFPLVPCKAIEILLPMRKTTTVLQRVQPHKHLGCIFQGLPQWLSGKECACQCGRHRFNAWVGKIPGEGSGNSLQYSCLGNPMDRGAGGQQTMGVTKSWKPISD